MYQNFWCIHIFPQTANTDVSVPGHIYQDRHISWNACNTWLYRFLHLLDKWGSLWHTVLSQKQCSGLKLIQNYSEPPDICLHVVQWRFQQIILHWYFWQDSLLEEICKSKQKPQITSHGLGHCKTTYPESVWAFWGKWVVRKTQKRKNIQKRDIHPSSHPS